MDSFDARLGTHLDLARLVPCADSPGALVASYCVQAWALRSALELRPATVLLIVGENDPVESLFRQQTVLAYYDELAAGVSVPSIPPTPTCAPSGHRCARVLLPSARASSQQAA